MEAHLFANSMPSLKFRKNMALNTFDASESTLEETCIETLDSSVPTTRTTSPSTSMTVFIVKVHVVGACGWMGGEESCLC
jgi:hypothetical protein